MNSPSADFRPLVAPAENPPELTFRALLLGAVLGIVFGAATTYLALRVGLSVSASVPIAVIAIALLRPRRGQRAILEHNITQTTGSAGESVAAAVVFTVPALIFLGYPLDIGTTTLIALTGGALGVLMMVPLRRYLIVKEHGVLRYPEGRACAEILAAGEQGGTSARKIFVGLAAGVLFKGLVKIVVGVKEVIVAPIQALRGAVAACEIAPELLGVGYIIGWRTSVMMVAGSLLAAFILIPMIVMFGASGDAVVSPSSTSIRDLWQREGADGIWDQYIRHIGAGAVATGGVFALLRALPAICASLAASLRSLRGGADPGSLARTDRDTPVAVLAFGALALVAFVWWLPAFQMNLLGALLILVLGFLFAVVCSRVTGEVGSTSCPLSGMTIGVLMATCGVFLLIGWQGNEFARLALMVGAVVCICISNAGTCSQDLKTGYLVGATPIRQQGALLVGVLASVLAIGWTAHALNEADAHEHRLDRPFVVSPEAKARGSEFTARNDAASRYLFVRLGEHEVPAGTTFAQGTGTAGPGNYLVEAGTGEARFVRQDGIGSTLKAPQARLMSVVIDGLLTHSLPWDLVLLGVAIALFVELLGIRSLTFAVGVYLPLSSTMPVFVGGAVRKLADRWYRRQPDAETERHGTLFCSGLIAGAALLGIGAAMLKFAPEVERALAVFADTALATSDGFGLIVLIVMAVVMLRAARDPGSAAEKRKA